MVYVTDDQMLKELLYNYAFTNNSNYYRLVWTLKAFNEDSNSKKVNKGYSAFLNVFFLIIYN